MRRALGWSLALLAAAASTPSCVLEAVEGAVVDLEVEGTLAGAGPAQVTRASLYLEDAWLVACPGATAARAPSFALGPGVARAHHGALGTGLDGPRDVALGPPVAVGAMRPPAGRYCALALAIDIPEGAPTFAIEGAAPAGGFADEAYARALWEVPLAEPLVLDLARPTARVRLDLDVGDAVDRAGPDAVRALQRLGAVARATVLSRGE